MLRQKASQVRRFFRTSRSDPIFCKINSGSTLCYTKWILETTKSMDRKSNLLFFVAFCSSLNINELPRIPPTRLIIFGEFLKGMYGTRCKMEFYSTFYFTIEQKSITLTNAIFSYFWKSAYEHPTTATLIWNATLLLFSTFPVQSKRLIRIKRVTKFLVWKTKFGSTRLPFGLWNVVFISWCEDVAGLSIVPVR